MASTAPAPRAPAKKIGAEIYCAPENKVVGRVEVPRSLDAASIRSGFIDSDPARCPPNEEIVDGRRMRCRRCSSDLHFRTAGAILVEATPGIYELEG